MSTFFQFQSLRAARHAITTRHGGVSKTPYASLNLGLSTNDDPVNVLANRAIALNTVGAPPETALFGRLNHGKEVSIFRRDRPEEWPVRHAPRVGGGVDAAFMSDAAVTDARGLHFVLTFADCVPLAFLDRVTGAIGAAHAGWRGTALGIGPAVVRAMGWAFGSQPEDIVVGIGPSIGPCCYEVGDDVPARFAQEGNTAVLNGKRLDLWASNRQQLVTAGVTESAIEVAELCTRCHVDDFYSHRGESGVTGRFAMIIGR